MILPELGLFTSKDAVNLCKARKISCVNGSFTFLTFLIIASVQLLFVHEGEIRTDASDDYHLSPMIRFPLVLQVFTGRLLRSK